MGEKIELCFRAMRFTPLLGIIDLLLILHFCTSWYRSARRTGWKIDLWYITLFLGAFQSILILYPFNASIFNFKVTLGLIEKISPFVDQAFLVSILGYICIWLGRYTYDFTHGKFPLIVFCRLSLPLCQLFEKNVKNRNAFFVLTITTIVLGAAILGIQFANGEFFNGRRFFLRSPEFRPFFNIAISFFSIAITFATLRFVHFKEKIVLKIFGFILILAFFFGIRSLVLYGLLGMGIVKAFQNEGRVSLKKIAGIFSLFFFLAVALGHIREGNYNFIQSFTTLFFNFFYGNNFSDTRDFAWILSYWDGEYLYGKTYVAALLSFIPRSLISLREEWGIATYTNALAGFSSNLMPGLRPGLFGESYLNFGLPGVVLFGWMFGFALRFADLKIKEYVILSKDLIKGYSHLILFNLMSALAVTAGIWTFYIFILVNFALVPFRKFVAVKN